MSRQKCAGSWWAGVLQRLSVHSSKAPETPKHLGEEEWGFCCAYSQSVFRENHTSQMAADLHCTLFFLSLPVCDNLENFTSGSPFLCMDLSYITALLKDGFGFASSTVLRVRERTPVSRNSPLTPRNVEIISFRLWTRQCARHHEYGKSAWWSSSF